ESVFVLRGSAGTGKTTLMKTVVNYVNELGLCAELLAPTGKAASILKKKTQFPAHTIHHLIYMPSQLEDGRVLLNYKPNESDIRTVYIVDEASMLAAEQISKEDFISSKPLLTDFLNFVKEGNEKNQIIFLGD